MSIVKSYFSGTFFLEYNLQINVLAFYIEFIKPSMYFTVSFSRIVYLYLWVRICCFLLYLYLTVPIS